ncbi:DUF6660 family protein [Aquimarina sp. 2201CG14-23]|uniref:DUF6660 family protein n=1 Tax=Aquimarina mycalae TaxID=3040073 RepID=UPI0024782C8A|nr:DUF6660 family protein [Aquimarina sp. 2201CG14-23]MDH7445554.1 hypothetical protein [Aquimarina sp. 2201CG14-23]
MKLFAFILSIFILCSTLTPCSDAFNEEHQNEVSLDDTHDHSKDKDDSCPSICICACCGVTITYESFQQISIDSKTIIISKADVVYQSEYAFYYFPAIWQPPQWIS